MNCDCWLVFCFVGFWLPDDERFEGYVAVVLFGFDSALFGFECKFVVDEWVVESDGCCVIFCCGVVEFVDVCPIYCAEAHWAWFAGWVDFAAFEVECAELFACFAYGVDFGMGCWIVIGCYTIAWWGYDFAIFYYYGSERASLIFDIFVGYSDGAWIFCCMAFYYLF